jgi:hypothetical protein
MRIDRERVSRQRSRRCPGGIRRAPLMGGILSPVLYGPAVPGRGQGGPMTWSSTIYEAPRISARPSEEIVPSTCGHNCGGRCVVNAHVQDGRIVRISTDPRKWTPEMPPLTACVRGFGALERTAALPIAGPPSSSMAQRGQRPRRIGRGAFAPDQPLVGPITSCFQLGVIRPFACARSGAEASATRRSAPPSARRKGRGRRNASDLTSDR